MLSSGMPLPLVTPSFPAFTGREQVSQVQVSGVTPLLSFGSGVRDRDGPVVNQAPASASRVITSLGNPLVENQAPASDSRVTVSIPNLLSLDSGITLDRLAEPPAPAPAFQVTRVPGTTNDCDVRSHSLDQVPAFSPDRGDPVSLRAEEARLSGGPVSDRTEFSLASVCAKLQAKSLINKKKRRRGKLLPVEDTSPPREEFSREILPVPVPVPAQTVYFPAEPGFTHGDPPPRALPVQLQVAPASTITSASQLAGSAPVRIQVPVAETLSGTSLRGTQVPAIPLPLFLLTPDETRDLSFWFSGHNSGASKEQIDQFVVDISRCPAFFSYTPGQGFAGPVVVVLRPGRKASSLQNRYSVIAEAEESDMEVSEEEEEIPDLRAGIPDPGAGLPDPRAVPANTAVRTHLLPAPAPAQPAPMPAPAPRHHKRARYVDSEDDSDELPEDSSYRDLLGWVREFNPEARVPAITPRADMVRSMGEQCHPAPPQRESKHLPLTRAVHDALGIAIKMARGGATAGSGQSKTPKSTGAFIPSYPVDRRWYTPHTPEFLNPAVCNSKLSLIQHKSSTTPKGSWVPVPDLMVMEKEHRQRLAVLSQLDWLNVTTKKALELSPPFKGKECILRILQSSARSTSDLIGSEAFSLTNAVLRSRDLHLSNLLREVPTVQVTQLRLSDVDDHDLFEDARIQIAQDQTRSDSQQRLQSEALRSKNYGRGQNQNPQNSSFTIPKVQGTQQRNRPKKSTYQPKPQKDKSETKGSAAPYQGGNRGGKKGPSNRGSGRGRGKYNKYS